MSDDCYQQKRTCKRIEDVKDRARPELKKYGWNTLKYATCFRLPSFKDNIDRVDGNSLSIEEFRERYEKPRKPVILTNMTEHWQATEKWTSHRIKKKYRNQKFKCGEDDDGYSVKTKMKYYHDYMKNNDDDSPLYIFDSGFGDRHKTKKLLEDYEVPKFFRDDLFNYATHKKRPPFRWFVMGGARSGTAIHIDPLGTSAWNALIQGHKRWVLIPPDAPKPLVKPYANEKGKHGDEAVTWFSTVYNRVRSFNWPEEFPVIEARQGPGDIMFVPSGWWHVVINEDETIAVTQNFCSVVNLHQVWPKTVKGRPKLSRHWYKKISQERPELLSVIEESMHVDHSGSSSSDSSSSSSSSSESSDDDSGCERAMMSRKRRIEESNSQGEDSPSFCTNKMRRSPEERMRH